ncbi:MAG: DUF2182 domain-containing protein [Mycobacteriales bacterium]
MTVVARGALSRALLPGRRGPEWWPWGVAATGCLVLVALAVAGHDHGGSPVTHASGAAAMVAMMAPLVARNVRYAALRSPREARAGVAVAVVAGWALAWAGAAILLGVGTAQLAGAVGAAGATVLATAVTVGWQRSPPKQRSLARCARVFAPPLGRRARRASCRYGAGLGRDCVLSCWPLMALMAVAGHNPVVVAACGGVAWYERRRPHHDPATRGTSFAVAAIGATALVLATGAAG